MSTITSREALKQLCSQNGAQPLHLPDHHHLFVRAEAGARLAALAAALQGQGFYLVTATGTDERELLDGCFKITYVFSHPTDDLLLLLENPLGEGPGKGEPVAATFRDRQAVYTGYTGLADVYQALAPLQAELADMLGLVPNGGAAGASPVGGAWLHVESFPPGLHPLRRDRSTTSIRASVAAYCEDAGGAPDVATAHARSPDHSALRPRDGEWLLAVGPIHAGVIEPGRFTFRLAGEVIEEVEIRLGYTHKGIERLFQTDYSLADGWKLAGRVAGDSAFAHSLAYCRAAEALAQATPPPEAEILRGLFLELERIVNHVGDCGALAQDVAAGPAAAGLQAMRETLLAAYQAAIGQRLLRDLNRPGGVQLPAILDVTSLWQTVAEVAGEFAEVAAMLARWPAFRIRLQETGILTRNQALAVGATGLAARASGVGRDFRIQHPQGIYREPAIQDVVHEALKNDAAAIEDKEAAAGDALARFLMRKREVASSLKIIERLCRRLGPTVAAGAHQVPVCFLPKHNFEFGTGYAEGWRGDVVYWLMQDKAGRIYRCKVRDPSVFNWPALKAAVEPHVLDEDYCIRYNLPRGQTAETLVGDFPIANKSFNLSYCGNDL
jgi:Ni,Fe-hydrogenase III large subunit